LSAVNLSRRGFLRMLGAVAPAATLAPKYFFAPVGGWKSETIVPPGYSTFLVGKDALMIGSYADYHSHFDMRLETAIDPVMARINEELAYRYGLSVKSLMDMQLMSVPL
jgi:hypothetical protein